MVMSANFDSGTGVGDCPGTITMSDGVNSVILPVSGSGCNVSSGAEETYIGPNNAAPNAFDCTTSTFTLDIGLPELCNYVVAGSFNSTDVSLPVEVSKFIAYSNDYTILLEWETLLEIENDFFTVEKSTDGRTFTGIGELNGAGNSVEIRQYMFVDKEPADGSNYYRLKQTDINGQFEYFDIVIVEYRKAGNISIYPNPVQEVMKISLTENLVNQTANVAIYSMSSGKQVSLTTIDATDYELNISTTDLPAGMYTIVINIGTQIFNEKIVKN